MNRQNYTYLLSFIATLSLTMSTPMVHAEDDSALIEEVVTLGSRSSTARSATDSPVPVDVFSEREINAFGNQADITDTLKALVPSYTATPATGDGSAFIRPTSLRGMAPDQTLILVNGKRRHRSALVQFFAPAAGNGAHGVDVGMIPNSALKNIEVLRDGAAAQYGSDAIAGVMNFQLKDATEGGHLKVQYGEFFDGEQSVQIAGNGGFELGENGFLNLTFETTDNDALSRGVQRPNAQALIDAGVPNVGADSPFGDEPLAQTWGRPETSGERFFFNAGRTNPTSDNRLYAHGGYAKTDGRYRFFYRPGYDTDCSEAHVTIEALCALGYTGLRQGYTPFLDGEQTDLSLVAGTTGDFKDITYDVSVGFGSNKLSYFLNNTTATDLGVNADGTIQRDFDMGGYEQQEKNLNADFSKSLSDSMNLAFGLEWRKETFTTQAGEANAYENNPSGMTSVTPADAGEFSRNNYAVYADVEQDINDAVLVQYALRYEDFSDFGGTLNYKIAGRWSVSDRMTLRGSHSTGFHAPTPGQANISSIITTFDGDTGVQIEEGLVPATSDAAIAAGGVKIKEEEAVSWSVGLSADIADSTTLTFDLYTTRVDDRIYRTRDISTGADTSISFYTNALDVKHQGLDLVISSTFSLGGGIETLGSLAFNHNSIEVSGQKSINGITPVSDSLVEDIENNYPENRFVINTLTQLNEQWSLMARLNYYGEHYDERGTIGGESGSAEIDAIVYVDLEIAYAMTDALTVTLGGSNIFDEYVDEINAPNENRQSVGLQYPRRTAANYEGGSWYLRGQYNF